MCNSAAYKSKDSCDLFTAWWRYLLHQLGEIGGAARQLRAARLKSIGLALLSHPSLTV